MENKIVSYSDLGECKILKDDIYMGTANVILATLDDESVLTFTPNTKTEKKKLIRLIKNEINQ